MILTALGNALLQSVCILYGFALRYEPFRELVKPRQKRILLVSYGITAVVNVTAMMLVMIWGPGESISIHKYTGVAFALIGALINIAVIPGYIREHLFTFGIVLNISNMIMTVPAIAVPLLMELDSRMGYLACMLIYLVLQIAIYVPTRKLLGMIVTPFLYMNRQDYWKSIWFMPTALYIASSLMVPGDVLINSFFEISGRIMMGVLLVLICKSVADDRRMMAEKQAMQDQLNMSKVHYAGLQTRFEEARKTSHDMKHLITALQRYIETDDKAAVSAFCRDLNSRLDDEDVPYTGNAAADGVIYHYMLETRERNIHFNYAGHIEAGSISDMDLCVLLGNALENALWGCMTCTGERCINVITQRDERLLSIVVHNSFDGYVNQRKGRINSRKEDHSGVGLDSMKTVCERYGGTMQTKWDEKTFTVMFLLPV